VAVGLQIIDLVFAWNAVAVLINFLSVGAYLRFARKDKGPLRGAAPHAVAPGWLRPRLQGWGPLAGERRFGQRLHPFVSSQSGRIESQGGLLEA